MLGGSFWIALLRNGIGVCIFMSVFLMLDCPRFSMKKTIMGYVLFGIIMAVGFSFWYALGWDGYVRFAGILALPVAGVFCLLMSGETIYLSLYKIALGFYLLAVIVFCGIDAARMWFDGNMWADIVIRCVMCGTILFFIAKKVRGSFLAGADILEEEMDLFSVVTLFVSIMIAALVAFW